MDGRSAGQTRASDLPTGTTVFVPGASPAAPTSAGAKTSALDRFAAWIGRRFPPDTSEPRNSHGFAGTTNHPRLYLFVALMIAVAFAVLWEWIANAFPVPPGEDASTWLLTSYAYVGLPHASVSSLYGYPPASFPFLGISVLAGGGPLLGSRIYIGVIMVALGIATYYLGRVLLVRPSLALMIEGLFLAEPHFQQIYYFGGYPNLFALVFLTLSLVYFVRFLRTRSPRHIFLFWVTTAICILSHSLTAVILLGTLVILGLALLIVGRLPRTIVASRGGFAGLGVVVVGVGAYYGVTALLSVGHPSYLVTGNSSQIQSLLPAMLQPLYLGQMIQFITGSTAGLSPGQTVAFVLGTMGVMLVGFVVLLWKRPSWLTTSWLVLAAMFLAVFAGSMAAYFLGISTDFRRFQYFLYVPSILIPIYVLDLVLLEIVPTAASAPAPLGLPSTDRPVLRRPRRDPYPWVEPVLVMLIAILLIGVAQDFTTPNGQSYETYYAKTGHDSTFIDAVNAITNSGIGGNILSNTVLSGHWPSALTGTRITYVVSFLAGNAQQYTASQVNDGELTSMTLNNRYSATNSLVVASVPGVAAGNFNSSLVYGAFSFDFYRQVVRMPAGSLQAGLSNGSVVTIVPNNGAAPPVIPLNGGTGYEMIYIDPGVTLYENVTTTPTSPSAITTFTALATGGHNITWVGARLTGVTGVTSDAHNGSIPGEFVWNTSSRTGNLSTFGNVTPAQALSKVNSLNVTSNTGAGVTFKASAPNPITGAPIVAYSINMTTPGLTDVFSRPGPWVTADQTWANWSARFVLLYNSSAQGGLSEEAYLATEYSASVLGVFGLWIVMLLPATLPVFADAVVSTPSPTSGGR